ncbi:outer membrane protein transport protein [Pricia sp. S334]|uniref:Outer membrane protein transport protein n=1 Tax=Pricia mediterranea TaxID=3076079 RepID=A0ABU3L1W1_9FLAO|nr:outer membrane protein transport protein [Pricia sp. S334]MDT7827721.1 outer membrane protein transport protein [Pricia sp. S334]
MKRLLTFLALSICAMTSAQTIDDVLRYSTENLQGTPRFQGMGGAFGALGGDLSALSANPAGSAVFNNSVFSFTGTYFDRKAKADYLGSRTDDKSNSLDINQVGGALVFKSNNPDSKWKKISAAFNYDMMQNYDDRIYIAGTGNEGIDKYFLNYADGIAAEDIRTLENETLTDAYLDIGATPNLGYSAQQAFLGFQAGIIDPEPNDDTETTYISNADYNELSQNFRQTVSGQNGKFTINGAAQYGDNFYFGASLNFYNVLYDRLDRYHEEYIDTNSNVTRATFENLLETEGGGFSFGLGAMGKLGDFIRLGASYQSPTWYRLTDNLSQRIASNYPNRAPEIDRSPFLGTTIFDYQIKTPGKFTGSIAAVFGKNGLLSFDYGYQDYSKAELRPTTDAFFSDQNAAISENLDAVSTFRVGGEYRIQRLSLRAGYRYQQSPYGSGKIIGDFNAISGGLGYNFGGSRLDFAINRTEQDVLRYLAETGINAPALVNKVNMHYSLGYTLNF